jgi:hypothetical protein
VHEQVVHGLDVFGEESHGSHPFWFREHDSAALSLPERRYVRLRIQR